MLPHFVLISLEFRILSSQRLASVDFCGWRKTSNRRTEFFVSVKIAVKFESVKMNSIPF